MFKKNYNIIIKFFISLSFLTLYACANKNIRSYELGILQPTQEKVANNIKFDKNIYSLSEESKVILAKQITWLEQNLNKNILIVGYAGSHNINDFATLLGYKRALAVQQYLLGHEIDSKRLKITSVGANYSCETISKCGSGGGKVLLVVEDK
ncbi:OmpA family protein [Bartonella sp. DGB1]|uniref:OmpA family protein n=1 Tax=Bartonella sp. DGB1 TaxID=3239807 RepID=UPI0035246B3D